MPPALPGNLQLANLPSGSNTNLYTMTSPSEGGDQSPATGLTMFQQQMVANVNPNAVPYVAGGAAGGPRYTYTR